MNNPVYQINEKQIVGLIEDDQRIDFNDLGIGQLFSLKSTNFLASSDINLVRDIREGICVKLNTISYCKVFNNDRQEIITINYPATFLVYEVQLEVLKIPRELLENEGHSLSIKRRDFN